MIKELINNILTKLSSAAIFGIKIVTETSHLMYLIESLQCFLIEKHQPDAVK